jgi:hypothetical protein
MHDKYVLFMEICPVGHLEPRLTHFSYLRDIICRTYAIWKIQAMTEINQRLGFTPPETVLSPKGSVKELRVLANTGEGGWSLSAMLWGDSPALGIRWNGSTDNPIGNPQSRGIATWFIVPEELAGPIRERYGESLGGIDERNSDITRVRLRPLPVSIRDRKDQDPRDDVWVLSITDRDRGNMEIMNPVTGHCVRLHRSHVKALLPDPKTGAQTSPKHGLLELTIQITFENDNVRFEPLKSFTDRIDEMFAKLWETGYENQHDDVRRLIAAARLALADAAGKVGPWETKELDYAEAAVTANFLRLALTAVKKAIAVHNLSPQEYEYGFNHSAPRS